MSIKKELMPNEQIIYKTKPHWIIYAGAIGWLAGGFVIYAVGEIYRLEWLRIETFMPIYQALAIIFLFFSILSFASAAIYHLVTSYIITTRRVIMQTGLIQRLTTGILLQKIEMIKVIQPLPGRFLGYGGVIIIGVGGTNDPFPHIPNPLVWREKVQYQIQLVNQDNPNAPPK